MSELDKAVSALRNPYLISENREAVMVYKDDLTLVLDRLEALQAAAKPEAELDRLCDLKVGDEVEVLVNFDSVYEGTRGTVEKLVAEEYPIKVRIPGRTLLGFARSELGKVLA